MSNELNICHLTAKGNIVTPRGILWFSAIAKKFVSEEDEKAGRDGAFKCSIIVPPTADLTILQNALYECAQTKWAKKPGQSLDAWLDDLPSDFKWPMKRCSKVRKTSGEPSYPDEYKEWYQINASTYKQMPNVIDAAQNDISTLRPDESLKEREDRVDDECYSGRFARISVKPATFQNKSVGVKLYLQNVQVLEPGERRSGAFARAEEDFAPVGASLEKKPSHAGKAFD